MVEQHVANVEAEMAIINMIIIGLFVLLAVTDIKYFEVPVKVLELGIVFGISSTVAGCITKERTVLECVIGITPGLIFIFLHIINSNQVALGDGIALIMSELCLNISQSYTALTITAISAGIVSTYYILRQEKSKKIPYIFYIALGHIVVSAGV